MATQERLLKALGDEVRLAILQLLQEHPDSIHVQQLVEMIEGRIGRRLEQPSVSHHLRILRDAGLIECRKKGLWAYYSVRSQAIMTAIETLQQLMYSEQHTRRTA